jgi:hypothetical protein
MTGYLQMIQKYGPRVINPDEEKEPIDITPEVEDEEN